MDLLERPGRFRRSHFDYSPETAKTCLKAERNLMGSVRSQIDEITEHDVVRWKANMLLERTTKKITHTQDGSRYREQTRRRLTIRDALCILHWKE